MSLVPNLNLDANNDMGTFETFLKRLLYDVSAYTQVNFGAASVADFQFGERMLYGRVNQSGRPIVLRDTAKLKPIRSSNRQQIRLVDFVADAFEDMSRKIQKDLTSGVLHADAPILSNFSPKVGYVGLNEVYGSYNGDLYFAFKEYVKKYKLERQIKDISSYYEHYQRFQSMLINLGFNVTVPAFAKSRFSNPCISGLVVDLETYNFGDDSKKTDFINSPTFSYYTDVALRHGFSIDKHIPTRLVADLNSPFMKKYMEQYNLPTADRALLLYYREAHVTGYDVFKRNMVTFYNRYASEVPKVQGHKVCDTGCIVKDTITRSPSPPDREFKERGEKFFMDRYIDVRNKEEGDILSHAKKEYLKKRANDLMKVGSVNNALTYIETEFTRPSMEANSLASIRKRLSEG